MQADKDSVTELPWTSSYDFWHLTQTQEATYFVSNIKIVSPYTR